jgi:plastocyanin
LLFIVVSIYSIKPVCAAETFSAYLFAFFTGNATADESIHFALSDDAHTFKSLNNGKPILSSSKISLEGGVRDPHILRGQNHDYYMVATDMVSAKGWASNHGIVMLKSTNLVDWKSSTVDIRTAFSQYQKADRVWAPQTIYDPVEKKYMVYFAMRLGPTDIDKIYYSYVDSTFTKLETAPKLLYKYGNNAAIDADIIYKDSLYYLFFKTEQSGNGIKSATSKKLTEGYVLNDKYLQATTAQVEGSCVFQLINSNTYILMYDVYTSGKYEFATSTDLKNFTKDPKPISFDFTPRHGTVIQITETEKKALRAKWNPTKVEGKKPVIPTPSFIFKGKTLELAFGKNTTNATVLLVDQSGKTVQRQITTGMSATFNMSGISAGMYQVFCRTTANDVMYGKVIVR